MEEKEGQSKIEYKKVDQPFPTTKPQKNIISVCCPKCAEPAEMEHINIHDKIAKCGSCATVFSFQQKVKNAAEQIINLEKENLVRPAGIEKSYFHDELELNMKQPTGGMWIVLTIFAVFFAGLFYLIHFKKGAPIYLPFGFGAFGLFTLYKYWNSSNERIFVVADEEYLSIQYRPKNLVKDKNIATREIDQIYVKTLASNYYSLYAIVNTREGQKHEKLITYIADRNKARYIEREIEKHLGIEDRRVPEEQFIPIPGSQSGGM